MEEDGINSLLGINFVLKEEGLGDLREAKSVKFVGKYGKPN